MTTISVTFNSYVTTISVILIMTFIVPEVKISVTTKYVRMLNL